jgi:putative ABC transport system permease protein
MSAREALRVAAESILANRLRSGLAILGMTIGVAAVIVLVAVGNGSSRSVQERIEALGSNVLEVLPSAPGRAGLAAGEPVSLTRKDAQALESHALAPDVRSASPIVNATAVKLVHGSASFEAPTVVGTTAPYLSARNYHVAAGEGLSSEDVQRDRRVVVIGPSVAAELGLTPADAPGTTITANGISFQIAGVLAAKGASGLTNENEVVIAPISTVQELLTGFGPIDSIVVQAVSAAALPSAEAQVGEVLDEALGKRAGREAGFSILNQGALLETSASTSSVFTTLLGAVAAISLLVGGIGVMNIMLVSVTERTREIGIRKALGARRSDIELQFLSESLLVALLGGALGVGAGVAIAQVKIAGVEPVIAPYSIFLSFGAALLIGLFFGTYPARRAAGLNPIEALRFE